MLLNAKAIIADISPITVVQASYQYDWQSRLANRSSDDIRLASNQPGGRRKEPSKEVRSGLVR